MKRACLVLAFVGALAACDRASAPPREEPGAWRAFEGSWTAAGRRHILPLGPDRRASVGELRGSLLLSGPARPGVGFRGEAITLADSASGMTGFAVWTDERGDQVFSELRGAGNATGNRITGRFSGGTGRYAGAEGEYEFSWQYVLESEDGAVQGRAIGLKGRIRAGAGNAKAPA